MNQNLRSSATTLCITLLLTLILLLSALARTANLLLESLWLDEGFSYFVVRQPDIVKALAVDVHPPLYFLLLRGWIALAGDSVLAMRYLSVLPAVLSVAVTYRLVRELGRFPYRSMSVAIIAALLLALSDADIYLAREARMYSLRTLLALLSVLAYARWIRLPTGRRAIWWVLSTAALVYTHYLGAYIPLIEGIHVLLFLRGRMRWQAIGALALTGLLFVPWLGVALSQAASPSGLVVPFPATLETLLNFRNQFFTGQWGLMLILALFGLVALSAERRIRWRPAGSPVLLALWVIVPIVLTFAGNAFLPILTDRNVMLITPAIAILVARGLANLQQPARSLLVVAIVVYGVSTVDFARIKPRWDVVAADAARYAAPGDIALMETGADDYPLGYYLEHLLPEGTPIRSLRQWRAERPDTYSGELAALLAEQRPVWLVHWSPDTNIFGQLVDAGYAHTATMSTPHLDDTLNVYRYDVMPREPIAAYTSGMILRDAAIYPDILRVDLWWSADETPTTDYSVSAFLLDETGALVAQHDSYPFEDSRPTTSWTPGEVVYDPHALPADNLAPGRYTVGVKIYTWYDGVYYPTEDGSEWATIDSIER